MKNYKTMEGESKNLEKPKRPSRSISHIEHDARTIFQPVRVRHRSVLANSNDWKFMGREFRFVLCCGIVLWVIHLLSMVI